MYKHIVIKGSAITPASEERIKELLDRLVASTAHGDNVTEVQWWRVEGTRDIYITIMPKGAAIINYDVLMARFYKELDMLPSEFPELSDNIRVCKRDARDYHGWFSTTDDFISFNVARQDQYMLRECYEAHGARGHVGFCELKRITGIRVFGEPTLARKVLKRITKETHAKENFIDLRPGSEIMKLCGHRVIVLVEATNGHFQIVNEGLAVNGLDVYNATHSSYKNVDYSFLYNHPLFH